MYDILLENPNPDKIDSDIQLWAHPVLMTEAGALQNLQPRLLSVFKGQFKAAELPLYERKRLGAVCLQSPSGSYYQGLRFWHQAESPAPRRLLDELQICTVVAEYLKGKYRTVQFNLSPGLLDTRGFTWSGLKAQPLYTFEHSLDQEIHPLRDEREKLRRAAQRGYSFERKLDPDAFLALSDAMFERKGHHAYTKASQMKSFIQNLHAAGLLSQYNVILDGRIVSANIILANDNRTAYTVLRASNHEEMRQGVSLWHTDMLIKTLRTRYDKLDLCGANVMEVARFKAAMGLELKLFFRISS